MVPFQNCVRQRRPVSKMATITKNRNFFKWPKLLYFKQKVPKFELYKHNDELFNIYYGIFYELWTFTEFDRLCKLEKKGGWNLKNIHLWANLNQTLLKWFLGGPSSKIVSGISELWDPIGNSHKNLLVRNHLLNKNKILMI